MNVSIVSPGAGPYSQVSITSPEEKIWPHELLSGGHHSYGSPSPLLVATQIESGMHLSLSLSFWLSCSMWAKNYNSRESMAVTSVASPGCTTGPLTIWCPFTEQEHQWTHRALLWLLLLSVQFSEFTLTEGPLFNSYLSRNAISGSAPSKSMSYLRLSSNLTGRSCLQRLLTSLGCVLQPLEHCRSCQVVWGHEDGQESEDSFLFLTPSRTLSYTSTLIHGTSSFQLTQRISLPYLFLCDQREASTSVSLSPSGDPAPSWGGWVDEHLVLPPCPDVPCWCTKLLSK